MQETNISNQNSAQNSASPSLSHARDYEYSLFLGLIIGVMLIPTIGNFSQFDSLRTGSTKSLFYIGLAIGFPLLCLAGLFIARLLVSRFLPLWQFTKFGLIGVSNTAINFGILNFFIHLTGVTQGFTLSLFSAVAFLASLTNSYIWNSHWSFQNKNPRTPKEFLQFFAVTLVGLFINSIVLFVVTKYISPVGNLSAVSWANVANLLATLIVMFWNFTGFKFFVFKS